MPHAEALGVVLTLATAEESRGELAWSPERCTVGGILHGGALMSLADSVGAVCAYLHLPEGATTGTVESKTNFFRAVRSGTVRATARPLHAGRSLVVIQTELHDDAGRRVAHTVQSQTVLPARPAAAEPGDG